MSNQMLSSFGGYKIIQSTLLEPDYYAIKLPPLSRNRSKRVLKKLMQRMRSRAYPVWTRAIMMKDPLTRQDVMICHPSMYSELVRACKDVA
jgi:hypothetical protein